jgi:hemoglobin-like flavoprotein
MSPEQIVLVRQSFAQVAPLAAQAGALFYEKLFARDPSITRLFASADMNEQARKLLDMIGSAVRMLDRPEQLAPALQALGKRHAGYGVDAAHYDTVGASLLETLAEALGSGFTPATREAWTALYTHVAATMQAGSAGR